MSTANSRPDYDTTKPCGCVEEVYVDDRTVVVYPCSLHGVEDGEPPDEH